MQPGHLEQPAELAAHHVPAADRAAQRRLVHHRPDAWRLRAGEQVLAGHPQADPAVDLGSGRGPVAEHGDRPGVALGLEQAVHELQLERSDQRGRRLQAQVGLEPVRQDVAVLGPPALVVGLPGQGQQPGPHLLVGHAVQGEQVGHVADLAADPAVLQAADLGPGGADLVTGLIRGDPGGLAETAQLSAEHHPDYGAAGPAASQRADRFVASRMNGSHLSSRLIPAPDPMDSRPSHLTPRPMPDAVPESESGRAISASSAARHRRDTQSTISLSRHRVPGQNGAIFWPGRPVKGRRTRRA